MGMMLASGVFAISIDLELDPDRRGLDQTRSLEDVAGRLISLLTKYQIPATWAVADPAVSAATDRLVSAGAGHEIAVLGDQSWVGREAGRSRFSRELTRRVSRGRSAGLTISTLVLRNVVLDDHLDLVVKEGISAVRSDYAGSTGSGLLRRRAVAEPRSLRFGLWDLPAATRLPGESRWLPSGGGARSARRGIDRAIATRAVYQLMIDGLLLAVRSPSALRLLERVLRHVDQRRQQGTLTVATLAGTAALLAGNRQGTPSHSILRPAA